MATFDHTPHGRGYENALNYFHHANDYWNFRTENCPDPHNKSVKLPITDLWEAKKNLTEGPARGYITSNTSHCSQGKQSGCAYEDILLTSFVMNAIMEHDPSDPLFIFWPFHAVHAPLQVPDLYIDRLDQIMGGRKSGGHLWG